MHEPRAFMSQTLLKIAAANSHNFYFMNQTSDPHHEKEHVKSSNTARFQSCRPKTSEMADI